MTDPSSSSTDLTGGKIGEYEIVARLGIGGMGIVYEGRQPLIGKRVAVKVLLPTLSADRELVERFISEARAVNEIGHRGIVDIFSFGQLSSGQHYFVMEYLNGLPFDRLIKERAPLPAAEALWWVEEICEALQGAHDAGVIHRDIKPSNLFLVDAGRGRPYVKLLDFGIAKLGMINGQATPQTRASMVIGTPDYMSPEQARAKAITPATDLYALGCVLFELLTGRRLFKGESSVQTMFMHVEDPPPRASSVHPGIPPALDELLLWTLEKDPAKRPASAEELRMSLAALRATLPEPTLTPRPSAPQTGKLPMFASPRTPSFPQARPSTPSGRLPAAGTPLPMPVTKPAQLPTPRPAPGLEATALRGAHPAPAQTLPEEEAVSAHTIVQPGSALVAPEEPLVIQKSKAPMVVVGFLAGLLVIGVVYFSARPSQSETSTVEDVTPPMKGSEAAPADVKPADVKPAETKVAETKAAEAKAAEAKVAEAKAAEAKAAEAKTAEAKAAEAKAAETKPVAVKPAETKKPPDAKPVEAKPVAVKPVEAKKPAEVRPAAGGLTAEAISSRIDKLEKKLQQKEAASGDQDRVLRQFIAQAKSDAAAASTDGKRREVWKFLGEIQRQLGR